MALGKKTILSYKGWPRHIPLLAQGKDNEVWFTLTWGKKNIKVFSKNVNSNSVFSICVWSTFILLVWFRQYQTEKNNTKLGLKVAIHSGSVRENTNYFRKNSHKQCPTGYML